MKLVFFDLETTGLAEQIGYDQYYPYTDVDRYKNARIVQIAMIVYDIIDLNDFAAETIQPNRMLTTDEVKLDYQQVRNYLIAETAVHNYIIKPEGFVIRNSDIHGIEDATARRDGFDFKDAMSLITNDVLAADTLIAHNIIFDKNVLLSELYRHGCLDLIRAIESKNTFCTSKECKLITKIKRGSEFKQPRLAELHKFLFDSEAENLHNAIFDTKIMAKCFFELLNRQKIYVLDGGIVVPNME